MRCNRTVEVNTTKREVKETTITTVGKQEPTRARCNQRKTPVVVAKRRVMGTKEAAFMGLLTLETMIDTSVEVITVVAGMGWAAATLTVSQVEGTRICPRTICVSGARSQGIRSGTAQRTVILFTIRVSERVSRKRNTGRVS